MSTQRHKEEMQRSQKMQKAAIEHALQDFAGKYEIQLEWPAKVMKINGDPTSLKTSNELIQHRIMESGILYDVPMQTKDIVTAANSLVANLERSDCFHNINVEIGEPSASMENRSEEISRRINIKLDEKNWYKLHAGAGLKTDGWLSGTSSTITGGSTASTDAFIPAAEMELRAGLRNVAGCLDRTDLQYTVDTSNIGTWTLSHVRPLYTILPQTLADRLLLQPTGSQYTFTARAALDTSDRITVSSYHEYQRLLTLKASTLEYADNLSTQNPWFGSIEYGIVYRDLIPRRHATLPYHFAASPEVVAQSGASVKHGITGVLSYTNISTDTSNLPVHGIQMQCSTEVAIPPGDVGFIKGQAAVSGHVSLTKHVALHTSLSSGYLRTTSFGGLCSPPRLSDRFLLGGTGSFRGFIPAGIGPRSRTKGNSGLGDALGGNVFYTATIMASLAPPEVTNGVSQITRNIRLFGFTTVGSCLILDPVNGTSLIDILGSSRVAAGVGIASGAFGPRIEATYTMPLRHSPIDGRRRFQLGISLSIV